MKKNIGRIQRWLDRLSSACENEKWDSALMEADCLSAEVVKTRCEILDAASAAAVKRSVKARHGLFAAVRTVGVALMIVFAASLPSAVEADKPWAVTQTKTVYVKEDRLSWVTPEEEELLLVLRSELSKGQLSEAKAAAKTQVRGNMNPTAKNNSAPAAPLGAKPAEAVTRPAAGISNEDLLALVQIGEKALRGNAPAIKIVN